MLILACGTSYYSSLVAKHGSSRWRSMPCTVEIASEYRYRDSVPTRDALVVVVSQSGETADTLAALKHAKSLGHDNTLAICNVATSSMVRQTELVFLTRAGTEIGVASTKAFTTQLVAQFLLALTLAKLRGRLSADGRGRMLQALRHLPAAMRRARARAAPDGLGAGVRAQAARAVPRPRAALSDRAGRRAEAQGDLATSTPRRIPRASSSTVRWRWSTRDMPVVAIAPNDALLEKLKSTCRKCGRAAASSMSSPIWTAICRRATGSI